MAVLKKSILIMLISVSLGIILSFGYMVLTTFPIASADSEQLKSVSSGLVEYPDDIIEGVEFNEKIKLPHNFPFSIGREFSEVSTFGQHQQYHHYFFDKANQNYIEIQVTDAKVLPAVEEGYGLNKVKLSNNSEAQHLDNGEYEFLYWQQDGLSYTLIMGQDTNSKVTNSLLKKLIKTASSLK